MTKIFENENLYEDIFSVIYKQNFNVESHEIPVITDKKVLYQTIKDFNNYKTLNVIFNNQRKTTIIDQTPIFLQELLEELSDKKTDDNDSYKEVLSLSEYLMEYIDFYQDNSSEIKVYSLLNHILETLMYPYDDSYDIEDILVTKTNITNYKLFEPELDRFNSDKNKIFDIKFEKITNSVRIKKRMEEFINKLEKRLKDSDVWDIDDVEVEELKILVRFLRSYYIENNKNINRMAYSVLKYIFNLLTDEG
ncbi:hypothetical protein [Streptococcus sp. CSL10205-OR2]|uniref:hypothetical protein n=1 Tax=Streptococcus sp. CSL10205-OR2 TaxID=2980558 RepID=UPI0021D835EC|nr:hypothetical protein [Streptococcus sp. CSL10205-OR2]MCU9533666.1 hypothetical protein [Streptococcus sp. CSL10205-OR2]